VCHITAKAGTGITAKLGKLLVVWGKHNEKAQTSTLRLVWKNGEEPQPQDQD
jgi:hypothetical protein